jgi:hypothetical protein
MAYLQRFSALLVVGIFAHAHFVPVTTVPTAPLVPVAPTAPAIVTPPTAPTNPGRPMYMQIPSPRLVVPISSLNNYSS